MNKYGMIRGESNEAYHDTGAVSASTIKIFLKRPYLYFAKHVAKTVAKETSAAFEFGSAAHEYVLQPELFNDAYAVLPEGFDGRTKEGKTLKQSLIDSGKKIISREDLYAVAMMNTSIHENPLASLLLSHGEAEISWRIKTPHFDMQSRTDWFIDAVTEEQAEALRKVGCKIKAGQPVIADLKTTQDLDDWQADNGFNVVWKYGYHLQLALYLAVVNQIRKNEGKEIVRHFIFIVSEKNAPNETGVFVLDEASFGLAQAQLKKAVARLSECYQTGDWNSYASRGLITTGVPQHIIQREEMKMFNSQTFATFE